jgi:hypothetical protein
MPSPGCMLALTLIGAKWVTSRFYASLYGSATGFLQWPPRSSGPVMAHVTLKAHGSWEANIPLLDL